MKKTLRKYLALNYLYYGIPFLCCTIYLIFATDWHTLQKVVNSIYANFFNVLVVAFAVVAIPNFGKLIYYTKRTKDMPDEVYLPASTNERFGGAGGGKTSSTLLQAVIEAEKLEEETEEQYNYMLANYNRWKKTASWKLKDFERIKKSHDFWQAHPEYIPYLASDIQIKLPDGRKSLFFTRDHLEQKEWLPICFLVIDEGGTLLPPDEWKDRPADVVLFFRLIRHFGIRAVICEQKKDGVLINVRAVLGGLVVCIGQRNALLPHVLLDIISFLKRFLKRKRKSPTLGLFIEKLQDFACCLGFRIWEQIYFKSYDFKDIVPPKMLEIVCPNKLPFWYDDKAYSDLYLAKDKDAKIVEVDDYITIDSEMGQTILRTHYEEEQQFQESLKQKELDDLKYTVKMKELNAKNAKLDNQSNIDTTPPK